MHHDNMITTSNNVCCIIFKILNYEYNNDKWSAEITAVTLLKCKHPVACYVALSLNLLQCVNPECLYCYIMSCLFG